MVTLSNLEESRIDTISAKKNTFYTVNQIKRRESRRCADLQLKVGCFLRVECIINMSSDWTSQHGRSNGGETEILTEFWKKVIEKRSRSGKAY